MAELMPREGILDIAPYRGGNAGAEGISGLVNLASNESALGPSPKAIDAYLREGQGLHRYPDGSNQVLRSAIARRHGLEPSRIVCGSGSDELIDLLVRSFAGAGDEVIYSQYGFLMYPILARAAGAKPVAAGEKDFRADTKSILTCVTDRTRVVLLANPNNPTGSYLNQPEIESLLEELPPHILLVVDAAYAEFVTVADYCSAQSLVENYENVVMTRTFSKLYGLAGLRLGWCYASPKVIDVLNRVRTPFNINSAAQSAGAAAIADLLYENSVRSHNLKWLPLLVDGLNSLGLEPLPSIANFVAVRFNSVERAVAANSFMREHKILVRDLQAYDLPDFLRISVGLESEMRRLLEVLSSFMKRNNT